jgi:hypothetical protein
MSNIIELNPPASYLDIPVEKVLNAALEANLESAVLVGWDQDGELYAAWSLASAGETLLLLELAKQELLDQLTFTDD